MSCPVSARGVRNEKAKRSHPRSGGRLRSEEERADSTPKEDTVRRYTPKGRPDKGNTIRWAPQTGISAGPRTHPFRQKIPHRICHRIEVLGFLAVRLDPQTVSPLSVFGIVRGGENQNRNLPNPKNVLAILSKDMNTLTRQKQI